MVYQCDKCQAVLDAGDAFCRRCGAPLAQEVSYSELPGPKVTPAPSTPVVEVTALTPAPPADQSHGVRALSGRVSSRLGEALKSPQGKRLAQGAGALALAVGVELVSQAAGRLGKGQAHRAGKPARPPANLADALLKAFEDELARPSAEDEVEEIYIRERITVRRIIRRRPG